MTAKHCFLTLEVERRRNTHGSGQVQQDMKLVVYLLRVQVVEVLLLPTLPPASGGLLE